MYKVQLDETPTRDRTAHAADMDAEIEYQDPESQSMQIIAQLLRDVESRRLPEALDIREKIADGGTFSDDDGACLRSMMDVLDQAWTLWPQEETLARTRENAANLCGFIMSDVQVARSNEH